MKLEYPKLILLSLSIVLSYLLFKMHFFSEAANALNHNGYISALIAGFLFSYGFTTAIAVGFFITIAPETNPYIAAPIAGLAACSSDILIFRFIRSSFKEEITKIKHTHSFQKISLLFKNHLHRLIQKYTIWALAGVIIASPLPDEFGVSLLSGFTPIKQSIFIPISLGCNTLGIFIILTAFG